MLISLLSILYSSSCLYNIYLSISLSLLSYAPSLHFDMLIAHLFTLFPLFIFLPHTGSLNLLIFFLFFFLYFTFFLSSLPFFHSFSFTLSHSLAILLSLHSVSFSLSPSFHLHLYFSLCFSLSPFSLSESFLLFLPFNPFALSFFPCLYLGHSVWREY